MKTINGILSIVFIVIIMISGVSLIFNQAGSIINLNQESLDMIALYDEPINTINSNFTANYNTAKGTVDYEPDNNLIGDEVKEYFDQKSRIDQLRDTVKLIYYFPDLVFLSIPFIDYEDTEIYRIIFWSVLWASIILAVFLALRNGIVTEGQK